MNPTLNIILKDLRRLRIPIGGWLLVMTAKYALGFHLVLAADSPENSWSWGELRTACMVLVGLETALTFLIAVFAIQGDSVLGTRSSWMTRPISGARLLRAKLGGMAALLVVPAVLLPVPWWLLCGFGVGDMAAAMAEIAAWQVVTIGIALVAAVLADSLGRVIVWTLVTLAVLTPTIGAGAYGWGLSPGNRGPLAALGVLIVTGIAVVVVQFITRERRLTTGVFGLGLVTIFGLRFTEAANFGAIRTPDVAPQEVTRSEWNEELARDVGFEFWRAVRLAATGTAGTAKRDSLFMTFSAPGIPDGYVVGGATLRHEWFGRSGLEHAATIRTYGRHSQTFDNSGTRTLLGIPASAIDPETERWQREQALGRALRSGTSQSVQDIYNTVRERRLAQREVVRSEEPSLHAVVPVPSALPARLQDSPMRYAVAASLDLVRPEQLLEIPLAPGSWTAGHGRGVRLMRSVPLAVRSGGQMLDQHQVALIETDRAGVLMALGLMTNPLPASRYIVLNRMHATLADLRVRQSGRNVTLGGVTVRLLTLEVNVPRVIRNGEWTNVTPDWHADARLALLGWRRAATFYREIQIENFELQPGPRAARE